MKNNQRYDWSGLDFVQGFGVAIALLLTSQAPGFAQTTGVGSGTIPAPRFNSVPARIENDLARVGFSDFFQEGNQKLEREIQLLQKRSERPLTNPLTVEEGINRDLQKLEMQN